MAGGGSKSVGCEEEMLAVKSEGNERSCVIKEDQEMGGGCAETEVPGRRARVVLTG